jgi:hypothetical protein
VSLVKALNIKMLYVPAAFVLLWVEQYSLVIAYFDNSVVAFIGLAIGRIHCRFGALCVHHARCGIKEGDGD